MTDSQRYPGPLTQFSLSAEHNVELLHSPGNSSSAKIEPSESEVAHKLLTGSVEMNEAWKSTILACLLNRPFVSPGCAYYNKASDNIPILFSFNHVTQCNSDFSDSSDTDKDHSSCSTF